MDTRLANTILGIGSIMNLYPNTVSAQISMPYFHQTDAQALASDWQKVGNDMRFAMAQIDNEQKK